MTRRTSGIRAWLLALVLLALTFGGAAGASFTIPLQSEDEFNIVAWELRHIPNKWLYFAGSLIKGGPSPERQDGLVARFLDLSGRIYRLEHNGPMDDRARAIAADLRDERDEIENDVEAIIEGRVSSVVGDAGLTSSVPLFPGARWVFPPVDVEFDDPPQVLSVSPRDRIELVERRPLRHDLPLSEVLRVEESIESDGSRSALVDPISGAATYPSIVEPDWNYQRLVETVAHEWVHQYLFFKPLGRRFYANLELRALNETVATLSGQELALSVLVRYPLPAQFAAAAPSRPPAIDVGAALQQLRTEVDLLLAAGNVEAAEELMELRRQDLANQGVMYRRINQAFFAFRNVYATRPGSTDPIGLKLIELRRRTGSVGAFVRIAAKLTDESDLDRLLAPVATRAGDTAR